MMARELKLSPNEVKSWSLSDVISMLADLISKVDNEMYGMFEVTKQEQARLNTRRL